MPSSSSLATVLLPILAASSGCCSAFMTVPPSSSSRQQMTISVVGGGSRLSLSSSRRINNITPSSSSSSSSYLRMMAIDYNDPGVMEEFNIIQTMEYDDVVTELMRSGVRAPADMSDMDVKLMLVELRTVMKGGPASGGSSASRADVPPSKFGSRFEECLWTKPVFRVLYDELKAMGDHNRMNVAAEYCNEPTDAKSRYYTSYGPFLDDVEAALNARAEITTPKVKFGGFPANMGEFGLKATLEAVGGIEDIYVAISDDGISLVGEVTFESVAVAKAAIEQYDGMDMGMGDKLRMVSV